jgi:hypothetical protein
MFEFSKSMLTDRMSHSLVKRMIVTAVAMVAIVVATAASADTIATSKGYINYQPGVYVQWSAVCNPGLFVDGYPMLSHGDELDMPMAWLRPLNVTSRIDSQTVTYTAYLLRWNGSTWVYLKDSSGRYVSQSASVYVSESYPNGVSSSSSFALSAPGPGYYRVAISANWVRNDTRTTAQSLLYWAPTTEANGSDATYCTFTS